MSTLSPPARPIRNLLALALFTAVALSGHVHEHREVLRIGDTLYVNPGPLKMAYAAELTVEVGDAVRAKARLLD